MVCIKEKHIQAHSEDELAVLSGTPFPSSWGHPPDSCPGWGRAKILDLARPWTWAPCHGMLGRPPDGFFSGHSLLQPCLLLANDPDTGAELGRGQGLTLTRVGVPAKAGAVGLRARLPEPSPQCFSGSAPCPRSLLQGEARVPRSFRLKEGGLAGGLSVAGDT